MGCSECRDTAISREAAVFLVQEVMVHAAAGHDLVASGAPQQIARNLWELCRSEKRSVISICSLERKSGG